MGTPAANQTAARIDVYPQHLFKVDVGTQSAGYFNECTGLEMSVKTEEVREGGLNEYVHKLPGRVEYGNLVLKRGYLVSNELFKWCLSMTNRTSITRKDVTVGLVKSDDGTTIYSWTFKDAYPVKWSGPQFRVDGNAIAVESIELAHRGLLIS